MITILMFGVYGPARPATHLGTQHGDVVDDGGHVDAIGGLDISHIEQQSADSSCMVCLHSEDACRNRGPQLRPAPFGLIGMLPC